MANTDEAKKMEQVKTVLRSARSVYESHYEPWESLGDGDTVEQKLEKVGEAQSRVDEIEGAAKRALEALLEIEKKHDISAHSAITDLEFALYDV